MENLYFAIGYTLVTVIVAYIYYNEGKLRGIDEACIIFRDMEPDAFKRLRNKLREELSVSAD